LIVAEHAERLGDGSHEFEMLRAWDATTLSSMLRGEKTPSKESPARVRGSRFKIAPSVPRPGTAPNVITV
jgi:hypothetical protein